MADGIRITALESDPTVADNQIIPGVDPANPDQSTAGSTVRWTVAQMFTNRTLVNPTVQGDLSTTGKILSTNDEDATSAVTGAIQTTGGIGVAKKGWFGDLVSMASLVLREAASKIVPGATSFAVRNNADTENNLLVSDAGHWSARSTGAPTVTETPAAGAGASSLVETWSNSTRGKITLTTGTSTSGGAILSVVFSTPRGDPLEGVVLLEYGGIVGVNNPERIFASLTSTGFSVVTTEPLAEEVPYTFQYLVIG